MTDDDVTMLPRQLASDLLRRMSHRKAFADAAPQSRLARQFKAAVPPPLALSQLLSPDGVIAAPPDLGGSRVAPQFSANRRCRAAKCQPNLGLRFTTRMQSINLNALFEAELAVTLSHRHNTIAGVALVS